MSEAADLAKEAKAEFMKTTDSYPTYVKKGRPASSHWTHGFALLDQIVALPDITIPPPVLGLNPVPPPTQGAFFAAYIEGRDTYNYYYPNERKWDNPPWDMASWDRFERNTGKPIWGFMTGDGGAWKGDFSDLKFILSSNDAKGTVPVIDSRPSKVGTLADFAAGKYDANIDAYAKMLATFGKPMIVRLWCEMNGQWYDYGVEAHTNPNIFLAAWQRVVTRTRAIAKNVAFHWSPNTDPESAAYFTPLEKLWPGDDYVDWAGMNGYQHAANEPCEWVFGATYDRVAALTKKPMMIGECGAVDQTNNGSTATKIQFINTLFNNVQTKWSQIKAITWFNWYINENSSNWDWPIESSTSVQTAFKKAVASNLVIGR